MANRDWTAYWRECWELCQKATPGPWEKIYTPKEGYWVANEERGIISSYIDSSGAARIAVEEADLEFIAASRTALPTWLQRVRELEDALRLVYDALTASLADDPAKRSYHKTLVLHAEARQKIREVLGIGN